MEKAPNTLRNNAPKIQQKNGTNFRRKKRPKHYEKKNAPNILREKNDKYYEK
jgi:hypothetical protein